MGSNGFITVKTILFQESGGGPTFFRGIQMLISIETHINCDFLGGLDPLSPSGSVHGDSLFFLFTFQATQRYVRFFQKQENKLKLMLCDFHSHHSIRDWRILCVL